MVLERARSIISDHRFFDLPSLLRRGDFLLLNESTVRSARLSARRLRGGEAGDRLHDLLILRGDDSGEARALIHGARRLRAGDRLRLIDRRGADTLEAIDFLGPADDGEYRLKWESLEKLNQSLERYGRAPLPPYIHRSNAADPNAEEDLQRYQTVFAAGRSDSVAAPTAGLHFTPELLDRLDQAGVHRAHLRLDVGRGTFEPVRTDAIEEHRLRRERYVIPEAAAQYVNEAKADGRRVVCVGTTVVRAAESAWRNGLLSPSVSSETDLFITPGYIFRAPDALLTNFHLPGSTLLMLVAAFAGYAFVREAYQKAVRERYRFFSYGDAMLIV